MKKLLIAAMAALALMGCQSDADVASANLSKAADNFEVNRRIVFYNGITGEYMLTIEGNCSRDNASTEKKLAIVCKTGPGEYKKHFLGLSDNVTYVIEQMDNVTASTQRYRVVFKPSVLLPSIDIR